MLIGLNEVWTYLKSIHKDWKQYVALCREHFPKDFTSIYKDLKRTNRQNVNPGDTEAGEQDFRSIYRDLKDTPFDESEF